MEETLQRAVLQFSLMPRPWIYNVTRGQDVAGFLGLTFTNVQRDTLELSMTSRDRQRLWPLCAKSGHLATR